MVNRDNQERVGAFHDVLISKSYDDNPVGPVCQQNIPPFLVFGL